MKEEKAKTLGLVFVYNADSGIFSAAADIAHKVLSPKTYRCNLCALTHSMFGMRKSWQEFLNTLEIPLEFLHADELQNRYSVKDILLPAVFKKQAEGLTLLIGADLLNRCLTIDDLKQLVRDKLS